MLLPVSLCVSLLLASGRAAASEGSAPVYKDPKAPIEDRVEDLLSRMTLEDKASQLIQGDLRNWINVTDGSLNTTGLEWSMKYRGGSFYVYAEGPDAFQVLESAKDQIRGCALLEGVDPDTLHFRLVAPARVQGKIMDMGPCPGEPIPSPYVLRASTDPATIQEN